MTSEKAPERIDIWVQSLCRELRQAGYFVPYERMMLSIQNVGHHVTAKDARIAELEAALEPFAKCADELDYETEATGREYPDDEWAKFRLLVSDYRRARAALSKERDHHNPRKEAEMYTVSVKKEVRVKYLQANMGVRYWEDADVDGSQDDDDDPQMPLKIGNEWQIRIDLNTGIIENWPEGTTAKTYYKVCDAGVYSLLDENGEIVVETDGYVPSMLCPQENGYGDYVIMTIDQDGRIEGFEADLSYFEEEDC